MGKKRVLSGIIFIDHNGLRWRNAPREYGSHKTLYNRRIRWSRMGAFARMIEVLIADRTDCRTIMIDATYLKAHRTTSRLRLQEGGVAA